LSSFSPLAEGEREDKLNYFTLEPDITTNFYSKGEELEHIQVRIDIMVVNSADLFSIELYQLIIRDVVIELLGE